MAGRCILAGATLSLMILVVLWLLFQHKPAWYQPVPVSDATVKRAQTSSASIADLIGDRLAGSQAVDLVLSDHMVNEWLAALPQLWPHAKESIPPEINEFAVSFQDDQVHIGGHYQDGHLQSIVNCTFTIELIPDGSEIVFALVQLRGGSLPAPKALLNEMSERLSADPLRASSAQGKTPPRTSSAGTRQWRLDEGPARPGAVLDKIASFQQLLDGVRVRNRFVWPNGDRPYRVKSISARNGELRLGLEPL